MKLRYFALACLGVLFVIQTAYYYLKLPAVVATHFDGSGVANNWMQKQSFLIFEGIILTILVFQFFVLPRLIEKMPDSLINLPNKKFWLAPGRRMETFAVLRGYFEWFAAGVFSLLILVNQLVYQANIDHQNLSSSIWFLIFGFLIFAIVWVVRLIFRFRKTL